MPESAHKTLLRHLEILKILETPKGLTVEQIKQRLERLDYDVTLRTVQRDIVDLTNHWVVERIETERPYKFRLLPGASNSFPGITVTEAMALRLLRGEVERLLPETILEAVRPRFELADQRLAANHRVKGGKPWHEKVASIPKHLRLVPPKIDREVLGKVQEALMGGKRLLITYQSLKDKAPHEREIHPRALLLRDDVTYLVATKEPTHQRRQLYALHRISAIEVSSRAIANIPFDLQTYLKQSEYEVGEGREIQFRARVSERLATLLAETPLTEDMSRTPVGDKFEIQAKVKRTLSLERWILGHGASIEVLEPADLRTKIAEQVTRASSAYGRS